MQQPLVHRHRAVILGQMRQHIGRGGEHGHRRAPAGRAVGGAELGAHAQRRTVVRAGGVESQHRFSRNQPDVVLQAVLKPADPVRFLVPLHRLWVHPHLPILHRDREAANVVGERVERAPTGEIEPRIVPVAGQDAVLHAAPVQRESHVRATVVHGVHLAVVVDHRDGMPAAGDHPAPAGLQFLNAAGLNLLRNLCRHDALLPICTCI